LIDLERGQDSFTMKGSITSDASGTVRGIHKYLDLRYASQEWGAFGMIRFIWTDEEDTSVTMTYDGHFRIATFGYNAGELGVFPFTLQLEKGKIS